MPLPKPTDEETRGEFIERCMADDIAISDFPDEAQRLAVCNTQWEDDRYKAFREFMDVLSGIKNE